MKIKEFFVEYIKETVISVIIAIVTAIIINVVNYYLEKRMIIEYSLINISWEYDSNLVEQNSYISKILIKNKGKGKIEDINVSFNQKLINIKNENPEILHRWLNNNINIFNLYSNETITFIIKTGSELRNNDIIIRQPFGIVVDKSEGINIIFILMVTMVILLTIVICITLYLNINLYKAKAFKMADRIIKDYTYFFCEEYHLTKGDEKEIIFPQTNSKNIKIQYMENRIITCPVFKKPASNVYLKAFAYGDRYMTEDICEENYQYKFLCTNDIYYDHKYLMFFETFDDMDTLDIIHVCPKHVNMNTDELTLIIKYWKVYPYHNKWG